MILGSDALIYPDAMMIHIQDTNVTYRAVMCIRRLVILTSVTKWDAIPLKKNYQKRFIQMNKPFSDSLAVLYTPFDNSRQC
jgi:hypothetical protein